MEQNNVELFFCDSSIIPVLRPIYRMLVVGRTYDQIQGKMQKEGTSLRDTYFAGAMGLVVAALEGKIKLVVNPVCFKELCLDGTKSKENIKFLFRSGLFHLAWPKDAYAFSRNSINRVNTINSKVGSLNRTRSVDPETIQKSVDRDFADKLSASQYEEFYLRGGVLLSLHGRTVDDLSEAVIEEFEIDTHKENNLSNGMRKQIEFKPTDSTFTSYDVQCHVHRNNNDFGDSVYNKKPYEELNDVLDLPVYSLGDAFAKCFRVYKAHHKIMDLQVVKVKRDDVGEISVEYPALMI